MTMMPSLFVSLCATNSWYVCLIILVSVFYFYMQYIPL